MKSFRQFDTTGMLLAKEQAELFSDASKRGFGSYYFLRRFASSNLCQEYDSLAILKSSLTRDNFWENEKTISQKGTIFPPLVMHWIGYIYRYWSYTEQISTMKLIQRVTINYLAGIYEAYHSLSPEQVVSHIKETLDLDEEKRRERVIQKFKLIYQSRL